MGVAVWQSFAAASGTTGADPSISAPSGTADGDLLVCCIGSTGAITPPSGGGTGAAWNEYTVAGVSGAGAKLLWKVAASEPASYTFVISGLGNTVGVIARITNFNPAANPPIETATGVTGSVGNVVLPTLTPSGPERLLFQFLGRLANVSFTEPGTATEHWDAASSPSNYRTAGGSETVGASPTGSRTWTPASGTAGTTGFMLSIVPAPNTITPDTLGGLTLHGPTLATVVTPDALAPALTVFGPTIATVVTPNLHGPALVLHNPTIQTAVTPDTLGPLQLHNPTAALVVEPDTLDGLELYGPTTITAIDPDHLGPALVTGAPTIATVIEPGVLGPMVALDPTLAVELTVIPDTLGPLVSHAPALATLVNPDALGPLLAHDPSFAYAVQPANLGPALALYAPTLVTVITPDGVGPALLLHAPRINYTPHQHRATAVERSRTHTISEHNRATTPTNQSRSTTITEV